MTLYLLCRHSIAHAYAHWLRDQGRVLTLEEWRHYDALLAGQYRYQTAE